MRHLRAENIILVNLLESLLEGACLGKGDNQLAGRPHTPALGPTGVRLKGGACRPWTVSTIHGGSRTFCRPLTASSFQATILVGQKGGIRLSGALLNPANALARRANNSGSFVAKSIRSYPQRDFAFPWVSLQ